MKVTVEFIDHKGFWHQRTGKSKKLVKEWIKALKYGTCVNWLRPNYVHISQQYMPK